jgi:hypothetical protein
MKKAYQFSATVFMNSGSYQLTIPMTTAKMLMGELKTDLKGKLVRVEVTL